MKDVTDRVAKKVALTETRIRDRLSRADAAHKSHLAEIRRKAVNENMKVRRVQALGCACGCVADGGAPSSCR